MNRRPLFLRGAVAILAAFLTLAALPIWGESAVASHPPNPPAGGGTGSRASNPANSAQSAPVVGPNGSYGELSAQWWKWAHSIPVSQHPLLDNGLCSVGQSGNVWNL